MSGSKTLKLEKGARAWLVKTGFEPKEEALWVEALTHGSTGEDRDYQRLEFLGDRVLGLTIADWLFGELSGAEGALAQRLNALVSKRTCANVARSIGITHHIRLGKQARDDGAADSENVLGDVMESLLGAAFLDNGFTATQSLIHTLWAKEHGGGAGKSKHPKSALQEWAAGNQRRPPKYELVDRSGPDHAATFTVRVTINNVGHAEATASNKQEAETTAAQNFMETFG